MGQTISCGQGCRWVQQGNRTGHCSGCHRTFDGVGAFDAHQEVLESGVTCHDPATVVRTDGTPRFIARTATPNGENGTIYWRLAPTEQQQAWLEAQSA